MKRFLTLLFTTLLLAAALCVSASASDYDAVAEDLSAIGMFRGTATGGFELDRAPTRSEAAIMLVRLYGAEEEAAAAYAAGEISHPFNDVSDTAAPYVAWLYTNGITNGTSATTFGSANACSAQNYVVFLLRALGYQDGTDFAYADAASFAQEKGFYDPLMFSGTFLRDDLAAVTYQALGTDLKDGSTYLLASLIGSGAVDAQAAAPMTEKIEAYRALTAASSDMGNTAMDTDLSADIDISFSQDGETVSMPMSMEGNMKVILDADDLQMAYTFDIDAFDTSMTMSEWLQDGWVYVQTEVDGETIQTKTQVDLEEQLALLEQVQGTSSMASVNVSGLAMVDSITAQTQGSDTVYTMVIRSASMQSMMDSIFAPLLSSGDLSADMGEASALLDMMSFGDVTAVYTVDRSGELTDMQMVFSLDMDIPAEEGSSPASISVSYDMSMAINATGDSVHISFPDFSDFEEVLVPEAEAGPIAAA